MIEGFVNTTPFPRLSQARRLFDDGDYEPAARMLIGHLQQHPDEPQGMALLGMAAMRLGALGQAEHFLRRAILRGATEFEVRRSLAMVLNQQERLDKAEAMMDALAREDTDPALRSSRANLLERLGRSEEAMELHEQLVEEQPELPGLWLAYGHGLRAAGRVDEAIAAYRRAAATGDGFGEAWWGLASIKRKVFDEQDVAAMQKALEAADDPRNIAPLHFALARAFHDRADHQQAFHHYSEGNRIRAESIRYDSRELTDEVAEVERGVDAAFISRIERPALGEDQPVFIVCLPRSGSTLLEQMLGSHPEIEPAGELPYGPAILRAFMESVTRRAKVTVPQAIMGLSDDQAAAMGRDYLQRASLHRKTSRKFFIDKLPQNWSNVLFLKRILPQAKFVDIRRPAMDCCFSNFSLSFTSAHASSFALEHVGQCYADYVRLMGHLDRVAPGMIHHVSYTRLVEDQQAEIGPVLNYLGLPWDDAVLNFHQLERVVRTPSSEQVRRPLNRDGMDVWKPYSQWLDPLRQVLGDLADG